MVWGCISCDEIGWITKVEGRMNGKDYIGLLSRHLLPYMQSMESRCVFMDDNAPCHRSQAVIRWLKSKGLKQMEVWPPQSPDLSPIDVWDILEAKLEYYKPKNLGELEERIKDEWSKISAIDLQNLTSSMPSRVTAVIKAKGGHTNY